MPIYEYVCRCCNKEFEFEQSIKEEPVTCCPSCKVCALQRQISNSAFLLKGVGWAKDLYASTKQK